MKNPGIQSATRLALAAFFLLMITIAVMVLPARAAPRSPVTVTNTNDSGAGSLRNAIATASPGDTIVFSLTLPATITLSSQLQITQNLTINGPGAISLTLNGSNLYRVIHVNSYNTLNLANLTIANGSVTVLSRGGGIYNDAFGTLTLTSVTFRGNSAVFGGGIYNETSGALTVTGATLSGNSASSGGGIYNAGTTASITNSTLSGNSAGDAGGGIYNEGTTVIITNSTLSGNSAGLSGSIANDGGGIYNNGGAVSISNSTLSGNSADYHSGGGIVNLGGTVSIINSTLSSNSAIFSGGGIYNDSGMLTVINGTFVSNSVSLNGGGIYNKGSGTVTLTNATLSGNSAELGGGGIYNAATVTVTNTIIANSLLGSNCSGTIANGGNNIDDGTSCGWGSTKGSKSSTNPLLGPLADNGGPTQTMALLSGSPAVDGVTSNVPNGCPATDQRGVSRPIGLRCDIGAFESSYLLKYLFLPLILR